MTQDTGKRRWRALAENINPLVPTAELTPILEVVVDDVSVLGVEITPSFQALSQLVLEARVHEGADYAVVKTTGWDTAGGILLRTAGELETLPGNVVGTMLLDVRMFHSIRFTATRFGTTGPVTTRACGIYGPVPAYGPVAENPIVGYSGTFATLSLNHFNTAIQNWVDEVAGITMVLESGYAQNTDDEKQFGLRALEIGFNPAAKWRAYGFGSPHESSWTAECWFFPGAATNDILRIVMLDDSFNEAAYVEFDWTGGDPCVITFKAFNAAGGTIVDNGGAQSLAADNAFHHVAMVRDDTAGVYSLYLDGNRIYTVSQAADTRSFTGIRFDCPSVTVQTWHIDEERVSVGARYTGATYVVPVAEFTVD